MRFIPFLLALTACPTTTTLPVEGNACSDGGQRNCNGDVYLMCLCDQGDPFDSDCGEEGGTWTVQDTLCATCDDWIDDECPVE